MVFAQYFEVGFYLTSIGSLDEFPLLSLKKPALDITLCSYNLRLLGVVTKHRKEKLLMIILELREQIDLLKKEIARLKKARRTFGCT